MTLSRKSRVLRDEVYSAHTWSVDTRTGAISSDRTTTQRIISRQVTLSEGHRWRKNSRSMQDIGGPFDTVKYIHMRTPSLENTGKATYDLPMLGGLFMDSGIGDILPSYGSPPIPYRDGTVSDANLFDWPSGASGSSNLLPVGAKFIQQTIPTNPVVDGSVSLAELFREGLPSMIGSTLLRDRASFFRSLGSEYLNFEFGWKPLISDLKSASKAIFESYDIMKSLEKYSGQDLRRKRILPPERTASVSAFQERPSGFLSSPWASTPLQVTSDNTFRQQWFSGCYKYYYEPNRMTELGRINTQARLLFGLEITPEVLWNLAPWSWLVDWFVNVGPLLSNVSSFQQDGLVMKYGYVMEYTSREFRRTTNATGPKPGTKHPLIVSDAFRGTRKRREQASPYGFGLNSTSFTNRQWAILGALGITRIPRTL